MGPIKVDITHVFHSVAVDLDNLAKPVLDALKGIVFEDDGRVSELTMKKRELNRIACVETPLPLLLDALARGGEFLHVVVEEASAQEVVV